MADQEVVPTGPPAEMRWPPESDGTGPPTKRAIAGWVRWLGIIGAVLIAVGVAGSVIRLPYDTFAPGGTLDLEQRVSVQGAKTYPVHGEVLLLFVRERSRVNIWAWLQAKLDPNIDLVRQKDVTGGNTQQFENQQAVCDMTQSQVSARVAALTTLGYRVPLLHGLDVVDLPREFPAIKVLRPCDEVVAADGQELKQPGDLAKIVRSHRTGTSVTLRIVRAGHEQTVQTPVVAARGTRIIGVGLAPRYNDKKPLQINVDTADVSGPSAGLAIALAIIDDLTPGDLTGGQRVAVTGTIDADGNVGPIGALAQKAVAARAAGTQLFIVPDCADDSTKRSCLADLAAAKKRVGKDVVLAPVSTLRQALQVLRDAGGSPVHVASST